MLSAIWYFIQLAISVTILVALIWGWMQAWIYDLDVELIKWLFDDKRSTSTKLILVVPVCILVFLFWLSKIFLIIITLGAILNVINSIFGSNCNKN